MRLQSAKPVIKIDRSRFYRKARSNDASLVNEMLLEVVLQAMSAGIRFDVFRLAVLSSAYVSRQRKRKGSAKGIAEGRAARAK